MPALLTSHADANEFGSRTLTSARKDRSFTTSACRLARDHNRPDHSSTTTSSASGVIAKRPATDFRAATSRRERGKCRRRSPMAGSAMTASPSQFGETTSSRSTSHRHEACSAGAGSWSRHRRCIQSQRCGSRRTYISSTSVQRCVNSRIASGPFVSGAGTGQS